ncbi:hypothetical protein Nepgr_000002 [Nepenthes gracilis]|uniref:Uncharacterized protein n=1 Tax=Nepenthes gracilis TaxID=150966 RepID=A0AAD3P4I2_NEPGR|nr:hypothetical protein Nepgr_000002 [Nepenthes gracilis]
MTSNPSTVEHFYAALPTFNLKLGDEDHCLFENGYSSVCLNPPLHLLHGSFYQSSEKEDNVSPCHKSCTEDPIGGLVPDLHFNSKLLFDTSKCDVYVGCPPPDDPSGLSFCSVQSFNSSVFSKVGFGQKGQDILQDIEIHVQSSGLSELGGSYRDTEFPTPGLSEEGSVTKDESNKSKSQLSDHEIVKLEKDTYVGNKERLSERMMMENSNSNAYDKVKDFILEVAASSIDAEEASLSLKTEELESKE